MSRPQGQEWLHARPRPPPSRSRIPRDRYGNPITGLKLNRRDPEVAQFLQDRYDSLEYFAQYAAGATAFPDREHLVTRLPSDDGGREKRELSVFDKIYQYDIPASEQPPVLPRQKPGTDGATAQDRLDLVEDVDMKKVDAVFAKAGIKFEILKTLGVGGNGMAFLCEISGTQDSLNEGKKERFVVKYDARGNLVEEKELMMKLRRSKHIVRPLKMGDFSLGQALANSIDNDPHLQMLEYMKGGDMHDLLCRLSHSEASQLIREHKGFAKQCWKIFICLIRACIDMQYPVRRKVSRVTGSESWLSEDGEDLKGGIPYYFAGDPLPPGYDLVHFDLDPQNVLVGVNDKSGQRGVPAFKVADFGLALRTNDPIFNSLSGAWSLRHRGKPFWFVPEQFHREWEFVDTIPNWQNPKPQVAGQFGPASNIYAIGNCMLNLLTGFHQPHPPLARGPVNSPHGRLLFPPGFEVRDLRGQTVPPFYTHGFPLIDFNADVLLRDTLLRCLADRPADRPDLGELSELVEYMERRKDWNVQDDWDFDRFIREPPMSPDATKEFLRGGWIQNYSEDPLPPSVNGRSDFAMGTNTGKRQRGREVFPAMPEPRTQASVKPGSTKSRPIPEIRQHSTPPKTGLIGSCLALSAVGGLRHLANIPSVNSGSNNIPQTSDLSASPWTASPGLESIRRMLRGLWNTGQSGEAAPVPPTSGDQRIKNAVIQGMPVSRRLPVVTRAVATPEDYSDLISLDGDNNSNGSGGSKNGADGCVSDSTGRFPLPVEDPFIDPPANGRSTVGPSSDSQRRPWPLPPRPLRRMPRRRHLRPGSISASPRQRFVSSTSSSVSSLQGNQSSGGFSAGIRSRKASGPVWEEFYHLYWPPERPTGHRRGGIFRRVVEGTRRLGRNIVAGRRQRWGRQRAALWRRLGREETAAASVSGNAAEASINSGEQVADLPAGYAGVLNTPHRGRQVFYVPPQGHIVPGFRSVGTSGRYGNVSGRPMYFYDAQSVEAQMILEAARLGMVPAQNERMHVVNGGSARE